MGNLDAGLDDVAQRFSMKLASLVFASHRSQLATELKAALRAEDEVATAEAYPEARTNPDTAAPLTTATLEAQAVPPGSGGDMLTLAPSTFASTPAKRVAHSPGACKRPSPSQASRSSGSWSSPASQPQCEGAERGISGRSRRNIRFDRSSLDDTNAAKWESTRAGYLSAESSTAAIKMFIAQCGSTLPERLTYTELQQLLNDFLGDKKISLRSLRAALEDSVPDPILHCARVRGTRYVFPGKPTKSTASSSSKVSNMGAVRMSRDNLTLQDSPR